ncbi:hypothetical protein SAMN02799622_00865 [Methylobacterium sp. UNC378MF]|uniref:hypothetical protein n=1 Tax=Methylobacterium sp. UNC378MF TaxID=1502748 RepID=UPI0008852355|nr:hypothetical protein [Methylobacterium sp. UNC378MF]SDA12961.1 hypothetical protein SAMN02799622_00865 [Methylobacterium sp. UNC378MF]
MLQDTSLRIGLPASMPPRPMADRLADASPTPGELCRADRTARMVQALPDDGAVVIVHSPGAVILIREAIRELRGTEVAAQTRVVAAPTMADERRVTAGLSLPVFRDHFVDEQREYARAVMQAWRL